MKNKFSYNSFKNYFKSEKEVSGRRRLYNSLWALFFGILISVLIISITGNNPFAVFETIFNSALNQNLRLITFTIVFIIATLGTAMCFKSGIFNIGVSGQMMASGMTTILILKLIGINPGTIILSIFIAILVGALISGIAAVLKAFLKVNEVVSTILLNWIIFYVIKFIIKSEFPGLTSPTSVSQNATEIFSMPVFFQSDVWIAILIIFGITIILSIWFIFSKTSFGYRIKMLGINKDASNYAGVNEKTMIIIIMSISGAFAGLAGFLYYTVIGRISANTEPISMGFDTIAIALLVYNNPFGIGISSILFSIIKLGCGALSSPFPPLNEDFAQIMFGAIIYIAAISIVFEKFKLYIYLKNSFIYWKNPDYKDTWKTYLNNKSLIKKEEVKNSLMIKEIKKVKKKIWWKIKQDAIIKKESLDKIIFVNKTLLKNLSMDEQENYFLQISLIKQEKDDRLFENKYFEILKIKNITKILKIENKSMINKVKKQILEKVNLKKKGDKDAII